MKTYRTILFFLFVALLSASGLTQTIKLTIFKPLPEVDLGALSMANNLSGAPRVFQISVEPAGIEVSVEGEIAWTDIGKTTPTTVFSFATKKFRPISPVFYNTDLGSTQIRIDDKKTYSNNTAINEIVKKGKPTGKFEFSVTLKNSAGTIISQDNDFVEFINPTQSFTINTPSPDAEVQLGNIVVSWIQVPGAHHYEIKLNKRTNSSQSLENALSSPSPYIDFNNIPETKTSIMVNEVPMLRPLEDGYEYVVQVVAVIRLPKEDKKLPSEIINFRIAGLNDARDNAIKNDLMAMTQSMPGGSTFASVLSDKNLRINRLVDENGNPISQDQLRTLLAYLSANPSRLVSAQFIYNENQ